MGTLTLAASAEVTDETPLIAAGTPILMSHCTTYTELPLKPLDHGSFPNFPLRVLTCRFLATRWSRAALSVHSVAHRPYLTPLARRITWWSEWKLRSWCGDLVDCSELLQVSFLTREWLFRARLALSWIKPPIPPPSPPPSPNSFLKRQWILYQSVCCLRNRDIQLLYIHVYPLKKIDWKHPLMMRSAP